MRKMVFGLAAVLIAVLAFFPISAAADGSQRITASIPAGGTFEIRIETEGSGSILYEGETYGNGDVIEADEGADVELSIRPGDGYSLKELLFRGQDVTGQMTDDVLRLSGIDRDGTLRVVFAEDAGDLKEADTPQTGDSTKALMWAALAAGSLCLIILLRRRAGKAGGLKEKCL